MAVMDGCRSLSANAFSQVSFICILITNHLKSRSEARNPVFDDICFRRIIIRGNMITSIRAGLANYLLNSLQHPQLCSIQFDRFAVLVWNILKWPASASPPRNWEHSATMARCLGTTWSKVWIKWRIVQENVNTRMTGSGSGVGLWLIYLEGGFMCYDQLSCQQRWASSPSLMSRFVACFEMIFLVFFQQIMEHNLDDSGRHFQRRLCLEPSVL